MPLALIPTPGSTDQDGCWSGYITNCDGIPTAFYTGVYPETQCMATSTDDDLIHWQKYARNPVIAQPPPDLEVTGFRDPQVFRQGDVWYMTVGSGIKQVGGTALLYRSDDLCNWTYMHPLLTGDVEETGSMWECPVMFALGDKFVLLVSLDMGAVCYWAGQYQDFKFIPGSHSLLDLGRYLYAAQVMIDGQGRSLMIGWVQEGRHQDAANAAGWAGVQSLPRVLSLSEEGRLLSAPVPELRVLRGEHFHVDNVTLTAQSDALLQGLSGNCLEIQAEFEIGDVEAVGFRVLCSPDGEEQTRVVYRPGEQMLSLERDLSGLSDLNHTDVQQGLVPYHASLRLHLFIDRSMIEIFAQEGIALTGRVYPTRTDSTGLKLFIVGDGCVVIKSLDIWQVKSIWGILDGSVE